MKGEKRRRRKWGLEKYTGKKLNFNDMYMSWDTVEHSSLSKTAAIFTQISFAYLQESIHRPTDFRHSLREGRWEMGHWTITWVPSHLYEILSQLHMVSGVSGKGCSIQTGCWGAQRSLCPQIFRKTRNIKHDCFFKGKYVKLVLPSRKLIIGSD